MTEFPWGEVERVAGAEVDARAALTTALPWWRAEAGARQVLERLGTGQVTVHAVAAPPSCDGEVLLLEAVGGGAVAGIALDPVFTQLLVARLLGDPEPELPAPRGLGPSERGLTRYLAAAALEAVGASWLAGDIVPAAEALALLTPHSALDVLVGQATAMPIPMTTPVSVTAATVATPSSPLPLPLPATRVEVPAVRVRSSQSPLTPTTTPAAARPGTTVRGRYRLLLSPAAMSALATAEAPALSPRALARLERLPIVFRASAGVATLSPPELGALAVGDVVVLDRDRGGLHAGRTHLGATLAPPTPGSDLLTFTMSAPPPLDKVHPLMPTDSAAQLSDLPIELTAELGRITLTARAALDLAPGAVVRLGRPPGPIALTAQGKTIAHGELVLVDGELGLRITSL